ncbi:MAG: histidinol dehydrogenase [Bacteroidia bacterium]
MIEIIAYPEKDKWNYLIQRPELNQEDLENKVNEILTDVKYNGDAAVIKYTRMYDSDRIESLKVNPKILQESVDKVSNELKEAIEVAIENITKFHSAQLEKQEVIETMPGVKCWRKSIAIEKVGLYIPGGTAPLFSTLLMLVIPAKIAGCKQIVVCTPPNKERKIAPEILYAGYRLGITDFYACGGAQAIGAMAFGTETIPAVYKIFGPGNQYVTEAKRQIQKWGVATDLPAGPSEVLVIAEEVADPKFVVADLLSQAEHGVDSQVILLTNNEKMVPFIQKELQIQMELLPRKEIAKQSLKNSKCIILRSREDMIAFSNLYAPEHLIIHSEFIDWYEERVINAGSVFLGKYTPESAGDYASGTNHTLPTNGFAKNYSGVSVDSFIKKITFQHITPEGLSQLAKPVIEMAKAEQLNAHAKAIEIRLNTLQS